MADKFDVSVRVEIHKRNEQGAWTGERLSVNEDFRIGAAGWVEVTEILGQFHALGEQIRKGRDDG